MNRNTVDFLVEKGFIKGVIVDVDFLEEASRSDMIKDMLDRCIKEGKIDCVRGMVRLLNRKLTWDEFNILFDDGAREVTEVFDYGLTRDELEVIFDELIDREWLGSARVVAKLISRELT